MSRVAVSSNGADAHGGDGSGTSGANSNDADSAGSSLIEPSGSTTYRLLSSSSSPIADPQRLADATDRSHEVLGVLYTHMLALPIRI